ncbi:transmembrane amino acid transporter protein-domain-containing protein [Daldinia caldariorum]|uniref:transmembrane amino acid transporter protein-domain-containing protein n=1 Tax=Daldinia caldariorum TaxID=326644 RepID=UPI0020074BC8|nr:transmembrane amino acid transporter protein-domain-containing protein [Daldinia caldariorum]KAI1464543.1 transmembrane amino acid transporter protein-domain-containing protein [Daldinia caldariorum]
MAGHTPSQKKIEGSDYNGVVRVDQEEGLHSSALPNDVFGREDDHEIKYKTLSWPLTAVLMITEIISNGMLSLPSSLDAVGLVPGVIVIAFLGAFATFTAWLLVEFKLRHPEVHNMGDAGNILFGPVGREILSAGTVIFAVCSAGSQILAGQLALTVLSDAKLCATAFSGIFTVAVAICSFPRVLHDLSLVWIIGGISIISAGIVAMVGAGAVPVDPGNIVIARSSDFTSAFISLTNPVFAYAGHFVFFIFISEMRNPKDAMKAAWTLQIVATSFYIAFAVVTYWYIGKGVSSPSLLSLSTLWSKISFGLAIPNFFIAGSLNLHTAAKLVFVRLFRQSRHIHSHTFTGWGVWTLLVLLVNTVAFLFAVGIPIFNYLVGIAASMFAAWYAYGLAGAFWLHDTYHYRGGYSGWFKRPIMFTLNIFTVLAGGFICIGGLYATIYSLREAANAGELPPPFQC